MLIAVFSSGKKILSSPSVPILKSFGLIVFFCSQMIPLIWENSHFEISMLKVFFTKYEGVFNQVLKSVLKFTDAGFECH